MTTRLLTALAAAGAMMLATAAQATTLLYHFDLSGAAEAPPNASPGTGQGLITIDTTTHLITYDVSFAGLLGNTTASHIHCCTTTPGVSTAGVATTTPNFPGFPLGVSFGTFQASFDMSVASSWNAAFINANGGTPLSAETAFLAGIAAGRAYYNVHTNVVPSGEVRGFLTPAPEPATMAVLTVGALAAIGARGRRRRAA